ncbi:MAG: ABC transporter ATP-binding protein [Candidatus Bathyarchaeia archaeon]
MKDSAVFVTELSKTYKGNIEALKKVSLNVKKGGLYTLLGPNGAGKTTFLRIISTQLMPTSGEAYVFGYDVVKEAEMVRQLIAVVPQDVATYGIYTPWEYAYYFAKLRGINRQKAKETAEKALKAVELWELRNRPCSSLSGGEKKRAIIASALSSEAELLMLDEPTSGLDAVARRKVWAVLREMVKDGKTILLTTHIMEEAEMVSDKLAILNKGEIIASGSPEEIKTLVEERFRIVVDGDHEFLSSYNSAKIGDKTIVYVKTQEEALSLIERVFKKDGRAETAPITLEDIFVKLVGEVRNEIP